MNKLNELRTQLLDLTKRNRLINYPLNEVKGIRLVETSLNNLFQQLKNNKALELTFVAEPTIDEIDKHNSGEKNRQPKENYAPKARDWAKVLSISTEYSLPLQSEEKTKSKVQTLFYPDSLDSRLTHFMRKDKEASSEVGFNICYLVLGFLKWKVDSKDEKYVYSPLISVPISIDKKRKINALDDELSHNIALECKLDKHYEIQLPRFNNVEDNDDFLESYLNQVKEVIAEKKDWAIESFASICLLNFSTQAMYNDLEGKNWSKLNDIIEQFLGRGDENAGEPSETPYGELADIDRLETENPNQYPIVFDADSSQHTALIDAIEGKNLVIEGPPGTGKSQTISNIISTLLASGKKVLFIAEKMTALEVVKQKLDDIGIGDFCLELHSNGAQKQRVIGEISRTLALKKTQRPRALDDTIEQFEEEKNELNQYTLTISQLFGETELTIHQIFNRATRYQTEIVDTALNPHELVIPTITPENFTPLEQEKFERDLSSFVNMYQKLASEAPEQKISNHFWYGVEKANFNQYEVDELFIALSTWQDELKSLNELWCKRRNDFSVAYDETPPYSQIINLTDNLSEITLNGNEIFEIIPLLLQNPKTFTKYLTDYHEIHQSKRTLSTYFKPETLNAYPHEELACALRTAQQLGIDDSTSAKSLLADYKHIEQLIKQGNELQVHFDKIVPKLPTAIQPLFALNQVSRNHFNTFARHMESLPEKLWSLRHEDWKRSDYDDNLEKLKQELPELQKQHNILSSLFHVENLPNEHDLSNLYQHGKNTSLFRFFSSDWRSANQSIKSLVRVTADRKSAMSHFKTLIGYTEKLKQLEKYSELPNNSYKGLDTSIDDLYQLRQWYKEIIETYGTAFGDHVEIGETLATMDTQIALAIRKETVNLSPKVNHLAEDIEKIAYYKDIALLNNTDNTQDWFNNSPIEPLGECLRDTLQILKKHLSADHRLADIQTQLKNLVSLSQKVEQWQQSEFSQSLHAQSYSLSSDIGQFNESLLQKGQSTLALTEVLAQNSWSSDNYSDAPTQETCQDFVAFAEQLSAVISRIEACERHFADKGAVNLTDWWGNVIDSTITDRLTHNEKALAHKDELTSWTTFLQFKATCLDEWQLPFQPQEPPYHTSITDYIHAILATTYTQLANVVFEQEPQLKQFNSLTHEDHRSRFKTIDKELLKIKRQALIAEIQKCQNCPTGSNRGRVGDYTELGLINHVKKQTRPQISIRDLLLRATESIQSLKPCFMMSPMSVAQYLTPEKIQFDVVIMDEASQIEPIYAFGAIQRAQQVIVVGDPKQLPPTNFFNSATNVDDEEEQLGIQEAESILTAVAPIFANNRQLKWHYRSQHESLIAFSNHQFYDGNLLVFPSPQGQTEQLGIKFHRIAGCFSDGINKQEAESIIDYLLNHFEQSPNESIGVATMNVKQKTLIEDLWDKKIQENPQLQILVEKNEESEFPLFIKNLESVQGDERDDIVISMTYGPQNVGAKGVPQRFGPINNNGGERRLNVLFTRAKKRMVVFSSMGSSDILDSGGEGKKALKDFLSYCETGRLTDIQLTGKAPDSDFEIAVINRLNKAGFKCAPQLGVSGYFLDIAVINPEKEGQYLMAVECDGATYHSLKSARDRDRLRQEVLESQGWVVRRIWSTNWFKNPDATLAPILKELCQMVDSANLAETKSLKPIIKKVMEK